MVKKSTLIEEATADLAAMNLKREADASAAITAEADRDGTGSRPAPPEPSRTVIDLPFTPEDVRAGTAGKKAKKPKKGSAEAQQAIVSLNEQGIAIPANIDAAYRIADAMWKGGAFPKWVKTPIQALAVSQFCRSLRLDPMTGVQHVCEVNGRLALWGEGPLAAVRAHGQLANIREIFLADKYVEICLKNQNLDAPLFASVCQLSRRHPDGRIEEVERFFTKADELKAMKGLPDVWKGYQRIMYKRKSRAEGIKDLFGDVVAGARIAEYDDNFAPDALTEGKPQASLADQMNQRQIGEPSGS